MLEGLLAAAALQAPAAVPYTAADFAHIARLAGRWEGRSPDGRAVVDTYALVDPHSLHRTRRTGNALVTVTDGPTIRFAGGTITAHWGSYSWRAVEVTKRLVRFAPVTASDGFAWRFVEPGIIDTWQDWRDRGGQARRYTIRLRRVRR